MSKTQQNVIQRYPPNDGRDWECQCARCGSSADWQECEEWDCEDGYVEKDFGDDVITEMHLVKCPSCHGYGGRYWCMSSPEWCERNPLEGREKIACGQIEWYCIEP